GNDRGGDAVLLHGRAQCGDPGGDGGAHARMVTGTHAVRCLPQQHVARNEQDHRAASFGCGIVSRRAVISCCHLLRCARRIPTASPSWPSKESFVSKRSVVSALRWSCAGMAVFLAGCNMEVLSPKGDVGMHEKNLILIALGLMSVVVIPVIVLTLWFAWRYRASNTKATYAPKWSHSTKIEAAMWGIPCVIIAILAVI